MALGFFRTRVTTPRLARLRTLSLFVELAPAELAIVDALMHERDYLPGEVIFDQGEEGQAVYIVLDGEVTIRRHEANKGGEVAELARLTVGTFFGELALLDSAPRMAQAQAVTTCKLAVFFRDDFLSLLDTHGRIASKIARQLARHIGRRLRELAIAVGALQHL
jgi:CRP/FNR family transcriptional regulator, cyclic AMP receptor protein